MSSSLNQTEDKQYLICIEYLFPPLSFYLASKYFTHANSLLTSWHSANSGEVHIRPEVLRYIRDVSLEQGREST